MDDAATPPVGQRVEIRPSVPQQTARFLVGAALLALAWWAGARGRERGEWQGFVGVALAAPVGLFVVWRSGRELLRFGPRLIVSPDGFTDVALGVELPWSRIAAIQDDHEAFQPRRLVLWILDGAPVPSRMPFLASVAIRLRHPSGDVRSILVPIGGLELPASEIIRLVGAYAKVDVPPRRSRPSPYLRRYEVSSPWGRAWIRWKNVARPWSRMWLFGPGCLFMFVHGVVDAIHPSERPIRLSGTIVGVRFVSVPGVVDVTIETPEGRWTARSSGRGHVPGEFQGISRGSPATIEGKTTTDGIRLLRLEVDGTTVIDEDRAWVDRRYGRFVYLGFGVVFLAGLIAYVEYRWRFRLRREGG